MKAINRKLTLGAATIAATLLFAPGAGMPITLGVASAAPLMPQAGLDAGSGPVILAKDKGLKCCGGGGGKGGKGGHGHHHHHHHGWGAAVGGIIVGLGYCAIQSERCEERYGEDTDRYWRCMWRAGCSD